MEKSYKITGKTTKSLALGDNTFRGQEFVVIVDGIDLHMAHVILLTFFNCDYNVDCQNWGEVRCDFPCHSWSKSDGTRGYDYEGRYYAIVEDGYGGCEG